MKKERRKEIMPPNPFSPSPRSMPRSPFQMPRQPMGGNPFSLPRGHGGGGGAGNMLARLFQRQAPNQASNIAAGFQRASEGGSLLKGLTNPGKIQSFLTNTQQVLKTAQQIGPMVQQYGPIVKNLPSMWKLYRGLKNNADDKKETTKSTEKTDEPKEQIETETNDNQKKHDEELSKQQTKTKTDKGASKPKLYI